MRTINVSTNNTDNTGTYYLTTDGDLIEQVCEGDVIIAEVITDGWYPGSLDELKSATMQKLRDIGEVA